MDDCRRARAAVGVVVDGVDLFEAECQIPGNGIVKLNAKLIGRAGLECAQHEELGTADAEIVAGRVAVAGAAGVVLHVDILAVITPRVVVIAQHVAVRVARSVDQVFARFGGSELIELHLARGVNRRGVVGVDRELGRVIRRPEGVIGLVRGRHRDCFGFQLIFRLRARVACRPSHQRMPAAADTRLVELHRIVALRQYIRLIRAAGRVEGYGHGRSKTENDVAGTGAPEADLEIISGTAGERKLLIELSVLQPQDCPIIGRAVVIVRKA